jgi:hypothetical protein
VKQHGKVVGRDCVGRAANAIVTNVTFRVQPAGLQCIRRRHEREVIAFAKGTIVELYDGTPPAISANARRVCFDPWSN